MIVLDAYALIALLAGEPAADEVGRLVAEKATAVPAPNLTEAVDRLARRLLASCGDWS
jgi:PIN domain nuclease of toxin-antitoxin system